MFILVLGIISLVPFVVLMDNYRKSKIGDFLIFAVLQLVNFLNFTVFFIAELVVSTSLYRLHWIFNTLTLTLILLHSTRLVQKELDPRFLLSIMVLFVTITIFLLVVPQIPVKTPMYLPSLLQTLQDIPIGSLTADPSLLPAFNLFAISYKLFYLATAIILFHSYHSIRPIKPNQKISDAYTLMRYTVWFVLLSGLCVIFWSYHYRFELIGMTLAIALVLIAYTSIRYPEIIILSHSQVMRALQLYQDVGDHKKSSINIEAIANYIDNLPLDLTR